MDRVFGSGDIIPFECINPIKNKWSIRFDVQEGEYNEAGITMNGVTYYEHTFLYEPSIEDIKNKIIEAIHLIDTSSVVNEFFLNEMPIWLGRDERLSLNYSTNLEQSLGFTETTLFYNNIEINLPSEKVIEFLGEIEMYAKEVYRVTHRKLAEVDKLETIEEILSFDLRSNYPEKLKLVY